MPSLSCQSLTHYFFAGGVGKAAQALSVMSINILLEHVTYPKLYSPPLFFVKVTKRVTNLENPVE